MKAILLDEAQKWLEENCENQYTRMAVFGIMQSMPTVDYQKTPNEPLTLEQLRQMDGEPVWIVEHPDWGHWELSADAEDYIADRDQDLYGLKHDDPAGQCGLHVLGWLAYRRPPEGGEINKITVVQHLGRLEDVAFRPVSREQVEKVWRGEWQMVSNGSGVCSEGHRQDKIDPLAKFCRYCGVPMTDEAVEMVMERMDELQNEIG